MQVSLPEDLHRFVANVVREGLFSNETEVLREALRLLRQREQFRRQVQAGVRQLDSGQFDEYGEEDSDRFLADIRTARERASARAERDE